MQRDAAARVPVGPVQHDVVGLLLARQHRRQQDAVVVAARLGAEHGDRKAVGDTELEQFLDGAHAGHAVARHHQARAPQSVGRLDEHAPIRHPRRIRGDVEGRIFDAAPAGQREVILVDRRRDHALALQVAGQAARQHVGAARRIEVVERVDPPVNLEQRELPPADERGHAGALDEILERAHVMPARIAHAATTSSALSSACAIFPSGRAPRRWPGESVRVPRRTPRCDRFRPSSRRCGSA